MVFDWDEANIAHIAEHDITSEEAEQVLFNNPFDITKQHRNGEMRLVQVGETQVGRILIVVSTLRSGKTRVVTAFPANRQYRAYYAEQKADKDGSNSS